MTFSRPDLLWLALALPAVIVLGVVGYFRRRRRVAQILGDRGLITRLGAAGLDAFPTRRLILLAPAALLLGLAAAGPQWGTKLVETRSRSIDIVLALDLSKSMLASDLEPNRLERQRLFASRLLHELAGDRIGLVVFAGRAYTLSPLTTDPSALQLYIDALDPGVVSQGGSTLSAAIDQSIDLVKGDGTANRERIIVLVSDGEALDPGDAVRSAIARAASQGIVIHAVGIGTTGGAPVPEIDPAGFTIGYKQDPETGETVISRLGEDLLREAAAATGGIYVRSDQGGATSALLDRIRGLGRSAADGGTRSVPRDRYTLFIALALALIAADAMASRRGTANRASAAGQALRPASRRGRSPGTAGEKKSSSAARTAAALLLITLMTASGIGDLEKGNRHYRQGRYEEAVEAYRAALQGGNDSPVLHYNLGTALLRLGRHAEAEEHLRAALGSVDPEERERTLYNLGGRFLDEALRSDDPGTRSQLLEAAESAYRDALRLDPDDHDAKWNLELARRVLEQQPPPMQGGSQGQGQQGDGDDSDDSKGGGDQDSGGMPPPGTGERPDPGDLRDSGEMTREDAERLLGAIERAERELQRSRLRKGRRDTPVARDW